MQNYSILFLDIDGTILDSGNRISAPLKQFFRKLNKEGIPVVLNSSRSPGGMLEIRRETGMEDPYVSYGGSLILDGSSRILFETGIPLERAVEILRFIRSLNADISVSFYVYDVWMTDRVSHPKIVREAEITIGQHDQLEKIAKRKTEDYKDMDFAFSKDDYLEIVSGKASKGNAVRKVCGYYNIPLKEAAACGDGMVDLSMLKEAGLGIAMGNSPEALKLAADQVTLSNEKDGVYFALQGLSFKTGKRRV